MARIQISKDPSGQLRVSFSFDPLLITKSKTILTVSLKFIADLEKIISMEDPHEMPGLPV